MKRSTTYPIGEQPVITEVFVLRSVACLCLVLLHAVNRTFTTGTIGIDLFTLMLTFGTPTFVFISELILAHTYRTRTPRSFWAKRVKYVLLPYLFFGTFYAGMKAVDGAWRDGASLFGEFVNLLWRHVLLGDYHGYFILIIFQFYLLHLGFTRYMKPTYSAKWVIPLSLFVNLSYLALFNFSQPVNHAVAIYVWDKFHWIPFPGWIFYFCVAYYAGQHYEAFKAALVRKAPYVLLFLALSIGGLYMMQAGEILTKISSKRIDMVFLSTSLILAILWVTIKLGRPPRILVRISQYSFGIYLLHPFFTALMVIFFNKLQIDLHPIADTMILFFGSTLASIFSVWVLQRVPLGVYFVGKVGIGMRDQSVPYTAESISLRTAK